MVDRESKEGGKVLALPPPKSAAETSEERAGREAFLRFTVAAYGYEGDWLNLASEQRAGWIAAARGMAPERVTLREAARVPRSVLEINLPCKNHAKCKRVLTIRGRELDLAVDVEDHRPGLVFMALEKEAHEGKAWSIFWLRQPHKSDPASKNGDAAQASKALEVRRPLFGPYALCFECFGTGLLPKLPTLIFKRDKMGSDALSFILD